MPFKIRVRDDDVLLNGKIWNCENASDLFVRRHEQLVDIGCHHVVSLLCGELPLFPKFTEYLEHQYNLGRLEPQIHGWWHIDYGKQPLDIVRQHLVACKRYIGKHFFADPSIWYTPWGAYTPALKELAQSEGLELRNDFLQARKILPALQSKHCEAYLEQYRTAEIGLHWWHEEWIWERDIAVLKTLVTGDFKYVRDRSFRGSPQPGDADYKG